jgi:arginase family enzyme
MHDDDRLEAGQVALLGVPWDAHSSFLRGPALAPRQIRAALHSSAMNLCAENGHDLDTDDCRRDRKKRKTQSAKRKTIQLRSIAYAC